MIVNPKDRKTITRVKGRERIQMVCKNVHLLNLEANSWLVEISPNLYKRVLLDMSSNKNKANAVEIKQ